MLKNLKQMTWGMYAVYLFFFILGIVPIVVFFMYRDNPNLGGHPMGILLPTAFCWGSAFGSFFHCLFGKPEGQYQKTSTLQQQEEHELTATH